MMGERPGCSAGNFAVWFTLEAHHFWLAPYPKLQPMGCLEFPMEAPEIAREIR
jgi:hypothetical protein